MENGLTASIWDSLDHTTPMFVTTIRITKIQVTRIVAGSMAEIIEVSGSRAAKPLPDPTAPGRS